MDQRWGRPWFAATFAVVVVELVITCTVAADDTGGAVRIDRRLPERVHA